MRILVALVALLSLMPGCCLVGTTIAGDRATAHNDEIARKLERGERLDPNDPDDQPVSVGGATAKGFLAGAIVDVAAIVVAAAVVSSTFHVDSPSTGLDGSIYGSSD